MTFRLTFRVVTPRGFQPRDGTSTIDDQHD